MKVMLIIVIVSHRLLAAGFSTDIDNTYLEAKKGGKPLLIDFFGIWCPPCNELDETVFENPVFQQKAKAFKLLKVDADKPESWKIKDRYNVGGYPTIVFTDSNGNEVYRIVGYRPLREFLRVMDLVLKVKSKPYEQACKSKELEDLWRCAQISAERENKEAAKRAFKKLEKKLDPKSPKYALARSYFVDNAENDDLKRDGYERLIKEMPQSPLALLWANQYNELFKLGGERKPKKDLLELVLSHYPSAKLDPAKETLGLTDTDLSQMRAELLSVVGKDAEAKAAWKEAAVLFETLTKELPKGVEARGFTMERAYCLEQAGEVEKALELANEYREKYPNEFTFHFQVASLLKRQKNYLAALPVAEQALKHSYGDNKIRAATLLVQLYATQSNKTSAKKIFDEILKEFNPEKDLKVRTHRYLTKLEAEMKKL